MTEQWSPRPQWMVSNLKKSKTVFGTGLTKVWSTEGALLRTLEGPTDALEWMCWHPRGNVLVAGGQDFSSWMWNAQTGACMQVRSSVVSHEQNDAFRFSRGTEEPLLAERSVRMVKLSLRREMIPIPVSRYGTPKQRNVSQPLLLTASTKQVLVLHRRFKANFV